MALRLPGGSQGFTFCGFVFYILRFNSLQFNHREAMLVVRLFTKNGAGFSPAPSKPNSFLSFVCLFNGVVQHLKASSC